MGFLDDDSRGFLLSMDLLIAIIPLTIVMGMMVADMDNMLYTVQSSVYQTSLERVGADTVNTLIKTSGSPYDWHDVGNPQVVGLAKYDAMKKAPEANYLSPYKLADVKVSDITKLTGPDYGFYLTITTADGSQVIRELGTEYSVPDVPNVVRIERIVLTSKFEIVTSLKDSIRDAGQSRTYDAQFPTNQYTLDAYDYWVLVINRGYTAGTVDVNTANLISSEEFDQPTIAKRIDETHNLKNGVGFENNIVTVAPVSNPEAPGASLDVYIIATPKGTSENEINLENTELDQARFVFYIWTV